MRICRYHDNDLQTPRWGAVDEDEAVHRMELDGEPFPEPDEWLSRGSALSLAQESGAAAFRTPPVGNLYDLRLLAPLGSQEVWGAGVTYERSKVARMEESESGGNFYDLVYTAVRPELFLKATSRRVVAPGDPIRIRKDSTWDVPEPELTLVVTADAQIIGYTVGNDVSSRSIEGENPLYLPQAKVYRGCCSLGPVITLAGETSLPNPRNLKIQLEIRRGAELAFTGEVSTANMRRSPEELVGYLFREDDFPEGVFLLTGTGIVPPDDFTLHSGDQVHITIEHIGTLVNPVA